MHCKRLCQRTSQKGADALADIHSVLKKTHSGALDTLGAGCQITYAQCVFFISTHKCGGVAVRESVRHAIMIWCIAKDCAKRRLSQAFNQPLNFCTLVFLTHACALANIHTVPKNCTLMPLSRLELSVKSRMPSACFY